MSKILTMLETAQRARDTLALAESAEKKETIVFLSKMEDVLTKEYTDAIFGDDSKIVVNIIGDNRVDYEINYRREDGSERICEWTRLAELTNNEDKLGFRKSMQRRMVEIIQSRPEEFTLTFCRVLKITDFFSNYEDVKIQFTMKLQL